MEKQQYKSCFCKSKCGHLYSNIQGIAARYNYNYSYIKNHKESNCKISCPCKSSRKGAAEYGGDYEQTWDEDFYKDVLSVFDPYYEGKLEVLTLSNKVVVNADNGYNRTWVSFTAPSFGEYTFKVTSDENQFEYDYSNRTFEVYDSQLAGGKMYYSEDSLLLEAGQKFT